MQVPWVDWSQTLWLYSQRLCNHGQIQTTFSEAEAFPALPRYAIDLFVSLGRPANLPNSWPGEQTTPELVGYTCVNQKLNLQTTYKWRFPAIGVSPNHPFIEGFSLINHPFGGTPIDGKPQIIKPFWWDPLALHLRSKLPVSSGRLPYVLQSWCWLQTCVAFTIVGEI